MSLLKSIRQQLGLSVTPNNNFTLDASADNGTLKLARGNAGATTQDLITVSAANIITGAPGATLVGNGPAFSATRNVAQGWPNTATTVITWTAEEFDTNNAFNPATGVFTAPVAGYYQFNGNVIAAGMIYGTLILYKNGVKAKEGPGVSSTASAPYGIGISAILLLAAGDTVDLRIIHTSGGTLNNNPVDTQNYFQGYLVRAA